MNRIQAAVLSRFRAIGGMHSGLDAPVTPFVVEPFLHEESDHIFNPLTNATLTPKDRLHKKVRQVLRGKISVRELDAATQRTLAQGGWLVADSAEDMASRFRLKYVSFEANTDCNQKCYFCPVSTDPRESHTMSMEFYERIARQIAAHRETIEGVSMIHYNEPTIDRFFLQRIDLLRKYGLPPAVLSNGTGLSPQRVDEIIAAGGLRYLSINLSTLDNSTYAVERGHDHLEPVLRNVEYLSTRRIAPRMEIVVLGRGDRQHKSDFHQIERRYANTLFDIKYYEVMDRAGNVDVGLKPSSSVARLCGCEQTGSRPVEWAHITPHGKCVLCCQDYHEQHVIGDLNEQSLDEILSGPEMARLRRWVYGIDEAPADFICRGCVFARRN